MNYFENPFIWALCGLIGGLFGFLVFGLLGEVTNWYAPESAAGFLLFGPVVGYTCAAYLILRGRR